MTRHTVTRLNQALITQRKPTVGYLHAFKHPWRAGVEHHFPTMAEEDRRSILAKVKLSVDERRLRGASLIIVDDIRVTGASKDKFLELLYQVKELRSLTVIFLCDVNPALARTNPAVESELNYASVETLGDVADIVAASEFSWNIRVAKFVMEQDALEEFRAFLYRLKDELLLAFYTLITINECHLDPRYSRHVQAACSVVEARKLM